jgi:flagellar biosynthesis protein FliQ
MTQTDLVELVREAIATGGVAVVPVLAAALVVGVVTGLAQAATGVHEPAVGLVPRLFVTGLVLVWTLPWMVERMTELFRLAAGP